MGKGESAKNPITLEVKPSSNGLETNGHCRNLVYTSANTTENTAQPLQKLQRSN